MKHRVHLFSFVRCQSAQGPRRTGGDFSAPSKLVSEKQVQKVETASKCSLITKSSGLLWCVSANPLATWLRSAIRSTNGLDNAALSCSLHVPVQPIGASRPHSRYVSCVFALSRANPRSERQVQGQDSRSEPSAVPGLEPPRRGLRVSGAVCVAMRRSSLASLPDRDARARVPVHGELQKLAQSGGFEALIPSPECVTSSSYSFI